MVGSWWVYGMYKSYGKSGAVGGVLVTVGVAVKINGGVLVGGVGFLGVSVVEKSSYI